MLLIIIIIIICILWCEGLFFTSSVAIWNSRFEWNCVFGSKNRKTLICAANQEAEEAFKKTVAIDHLIDMLREANPREVWFSNLHYLFLLENCI